MSKKTLILCVSVIGIFLIIVVAALYFLYSGTGQSKDSLADDKEYMLFSAVPSDANVVLKFWSLSGMLDCLVSDQSSLHYIVTDVRNAGKMCGFLEKIYSSSSLYADLMNAPAVISAHNIGDIVPVLIIDAGRSGDLPSVSSNLMIAAAEEDGLSALCVDASEYAPSGSPLRKRSLILVSPSDILVQSSLRHLKSEVSVLDVAGFPESVRMASGDNMIILPSAGVGKVLSGAISPRFRQEIRFFSRFADCTAFTVRKSAMDGFSMTGKAYSDGSAGDLINMYAKISPSSSAVASVLPSYVISAAAIPVADISEYQEAYLDFAGTGALVKEIEASRSALKKKAGISPMDWAVALDIEEAAVASFTVGGSLEKIALVRLGSVNHQVLLKGIQDVSADDCEDKILPFRYQDFLTSLFGSVFSLQDESSFILHGNWLVIGSGNALSEYTGGRALDYTLADYMSDASIDDRLSARNSYFVSYLSLMEDKDFTGTLFTQDFYPAVDATFEDITYEPAFFTIVENKSGLELGVEVCRTTVTKSQAPSFERDTSVVVPDGPFRVKNSGTGKWNLFYQQKNLYLCLQEEGGKGIWGVPFNAPICGCAQTVDYFANGKLQILFASGTKLYLIDRLGRFVNPFPVDLGKKILVGPDVYDFSGRKKYNVMILHTDNTIEMYNLQGRRPAEWKTITANETIKGLPERIRVGGSSYWVVRTSIQTLIFGFYGGEPLTVFSGDRMIRPDSEVLPTDNGAVEVICYDGKRHTVKLVRQ